MAIATPKKLVVEKQPVFQREEVMPPPKPVAVDSKYEPVRHLLQYVSGARWVVTYYKQLKTSEEASEAFNINRPAPYQQYEKIENFEIRVTSPLQLSPDNDKSDGTMQGVGIIYPSIVPDHGDVFIADIGDGRTAYFNIREVTQKSHRRDTVWEIEYDLINWLDHETLKKLDEKVVNTYHYERAYADYGANPKLDVEQHGLFKRITKWQSGIARHYFDSFFIHEYDTFLVPTPGMVLYDPYIVEFIQRLWTTDDLPEIIRLRVYNRDNASNVLIRTIWDTILTNDIMSLSKVKNEFVIIPRKLFKTGLSGLVGITYSRLDYIYHPVDYYDPNLGMINVPNVGLLNVKQHYSDYPTGREFKLAINRLPGIGFVHPELQQYIPIPDAKKYGNFTTYVLSPEFYQNDRQNMSKVERLLMDVLEEKPIDAKVLLPILEDVINWPDLERFYYIPLLVALSRSALGDLTQ